MRPPRPRRDPQRGNSLVLALIVMSALATLGSLTVVSMQSSIQMSTTNRAQEIALYAAESGAAVTMDYLRKNFDATANSIGTSWSAYCVANNTPPLVQMSTVIPSSDALPTDRVRNLFSVDQQAWFHIDVLNNRDDQGFATNTGTCDTDGILILRSTGHGPQGSLAIVEWRIQRVGYRGSQTPPPPPVTFPWAAATPGLPWAWTPFPYPTFANPAFASFGVVLLSWSIVSL